ncbi:acyltransferase family protein [Mycolicibacterium chlorophenolicum]|uniref:Acyltransferase family protein n=1 Tax=Mycolicibacterium chlorophenolicum TaxID=37916 RepID=A0A0J6VJ71_9MYCO|nr:acyltransferase [Mycolicibacterium chlorophenolicum]KMO70324.1 Acyltransferase family protein [Mycolicibacterium chlorophenolicum]
MTESTAASPPREHALDLYRSAAVMIVVVGHWLLSVMTYRDGTFGRDNPLVLMPWTQWITWFFQVVPVFFAVAGYASAVSWGRVPADAGTAARQEWIRRRVARVLGPTGVYAFFVLIVIGVLMALGISRTVLELGGWAVAMHLWFLAVYLMVVALTPLAVAAHRRWGLAAPVTLGACLIVVDAVGIATDHPEIRMANYFFCWAAIYQLGIAWHDGLLRRRTLLSMAVVAALALPALVTWGPYPIAMIGVPGDRVENSAPPSAALLALALVQIGVLFAIVPVLNRILARGVWPKVLAIANENVMALYLWHMLPVIVVTLVGYPTGLLPQPPLGSGAWWLARLEWELVLAVVAAGLLTLLAWQRRSVAAPIPTVAVPIPRAIAEGLLYTGTAACALALAVLSANGFAPGGRLPLLAATLFLAGTALVAVRPRAGDREWIS